MKLKKIISLGLVLTGALSLAACTRANDNKSTKSLTPKTNQVVPSSDESKNNSSSSSKQNQSTPSQGSTPVESTSSNKPATSTPVTSTPITPVTNTSGTPVTSTPTTVITTPTTVPTTVPTTTPTTVPTTTPKVEMVTVTFNYNNGDAAQSMEVEKGSLLSKPTDPTRSGFSFAGWFTTATFDNGTEFNFSTTTVNSTLELFAKWTENGLQDLVEQTALFASVPTVDGQDSSGKAKKYIQANYKIGDVTLVANDAKKMELTTSKSDIKNHLGNTVSATGINTGGVVSDEDKHILIDLSAYKGQATITLYVSHTSKSGDARTGEIRKSALNGDVVQNISVSASDPIKVESVSTIVDCGDKYYFTTNNSIRLYAIVITEYVAPIPTYSVTFESEHGTVPTALTEQTKIVYADLPTYNVTDNYEFQGWMLNGEVITEDVTLEGNVTLVAKWVAIAADQLAEVSFNCGTITTVESISTVKGSTITLPAPVVDGYRFNGWYIDPTFQTEFKATDTISQDTVLYGEFIKQCTVTFVSKDGSTVTRVVDEDTLVTDIPTGKYAYGFKFVEWRKDGVKFDLKTEKITEDITLTAYYEESSSSELVFTTFAGDQESAYAEWAAIDGLTDYNAYVKESTASTYIKLDKQLIRLYQGTSGNYYRVDALGLKAGKYNLKVVPVVDGNEQVESYGVTDDITVVAYDRTGFAFSTASPLAGKTVGAYNLDGTLKSNAIVIYVTESNKNTVTASIKNDKGVLTDVTGIGNISYEYGRGKEDRPLVIRFLGTITQSGVTNKNDSLNFGFKEVYKGKSNIDSMGITIEGVGNDTLLSGTGVRLLKCENVEIRNIGVYNFPDDGIALEDSNINIWVHDNDIFYGKKGSGDKAKGDGSMDLKDDSQFLTISYMHFFDSGKMSLCGMKSETGENYISYHHNWFDHSDSRHPRIRTMSVHVYNNYYDGVSKYGVGVTSDADAFVEGNYFRNCKYPMMSSLQGSDVYAGTDTENAGTYGTFSSEAGGVIKSYGNYMEGNYTYILYGATTYVKKGTVTNYDLKDKANPSQLASSTVHYDAYEASSRNEIVPSTVKAYSGGAIYNNFDTTIDLGVKAEQIQTPQDAKETIMALAGRAQGGDFSWSFNNAVDDEDYAINSALESALAAYKSKLIQVLGIDSSSQGGSGSGETPTPTGNTAEDVVAMIAALPESTAVTASDKTAINAAKAAFDALDSTEQAKVTNVAKLNDCLTALANLSQSLTLTFDSNGKVCSDSTFFTVTGSVKKSKDISSASSIKDTYAYALKVDSSAGITFTLSKATTVKVFVCGKTAGTIKVGSTTQDITTSPTEYTYNLEAGTYKIERGTVEAYIFYVIVE